MHVHDLDGERMPCSSLWNQRPGYPRVWEKTAEMHWAMNNMECDKRAHELFTDVSSMVMLSKRKLTRVDLQVVPTWEYGFHYVDAL